MRAASLDAGAALRELEGAPVIHRQTLAAAVDHCLADAGVVALAMGGAVIFLQAALFHMKEIIVFINYVSARAIPDR